jgi:hypothetical protein
MYVSTGLKSPYHKPEDDADSIDFVGMTLVCEQIYIATIELANKKDFKFTETHEHVRTMNGPFKLGASISYNSNYHNFSDGPYLAKSLSGFGAGVQSFIQISDYFALKPEINYSFYGTESAGGNIRLHTLDLPLSVLFGYWNSEGEGSAFLQFGAYYNYAFWGMLDGNKIEWKLEGMNQNAYGIQTGFGFGVYNFNFSLTFKSGLSNFFLKEVPGFGKAKNATTSINFGYYFLP